MTTIDFLTHVKKAYSMNTGGGIFVDIITLFDGTTLSISDEIVMVWESEEDCDDYLSGERVIENAVGVVIYDKPHSVFTF